MTWLVVVILLFLIFGPLRRFAFAKNAITFTLPSLAGGALGLFFGLRAEAQWANIPGLALFCMVFGAMTLGGAVKSGLDDIIRGGRDKDQ